MSVKLLSQGTFEDAPDGLTVLLTQHLLHPVHLSPHFLHFFQQQVLAVLPGTDRYSISKESWLPNISNLNPSSLHALFILVTR
jgi:hypothetical protein